MIVLNNCVHINPVFILYFQAPLGDLLVSLMYQPTANRIVVVVMKANQLKSMDIIGSSGM